MAALRGILTLLYLSLTLNPLQTCLALTIDRQSIVARYNPKRNASSSTTPMQVGNGNFAFGADVTGLQTFLPWAIMSSWGWKNDSLPEGKTWADVEAYKGVSWDFHGRLVQYEFDGEPEIQQWLISNPNRVNLGRIGLLLMDESGRAMNITEEDLEDVQQELDLWRGTITSQFSFGGERIVVRTYSAQPSSTVGVDVQSSLLQEHRLGIFLDFPWNDGSAKFSAPFVGTWNATSNYTTALQLGSGGGGIQAEITHTLDSAMFITSIGGDKFSISRDSPQTHRYSVLPSDARSVSFSFSIAYSPTQLISLPTVESIAEESTTSWSQFWMKGGFIDVVTGSSDPRAEELQRRIILSRYLMRVNEAGDTPPQEVSFRSMRITHY